MMWLSWNESLQHARIVYLGPTKHADMENNANKKCSGAERSGDRRRTRPALGHARKLGTSTGQKAELVCLGVQRSRRRY